MVKSESRRRNAREHRSLRVIKSLIAIIIIAAIAAGVFLLLSNDGKESPPVQSEALVIINEFLASNSGVMPDDNGKYSDWIEIYNPTDSVVDLTGFGLSDDKKAPKWKFPGIMLKAKGYLVVFASGSDISKADAAYQHTNFKLSSTGGGVYLFNAAGELYDKIEYKSQTENISTGRGPQDLSQLMTFKNPTPGFSNDEDGYASFEQSRILQGSTLLLTEINPSNDTAFIDNKGNQSDYIEIYNAGSETVELTGYGLSDDPGKVMKWKFPSASIESGAYLVVFASGDDSGTDISSGAIHTNFRISTYRESIVLADAAGYILDRVDVNEVPQGCSYSRVYDGGAYKDEWAFASPSPGNANDKG
jgi:hypothetical protein